MPKLIRGIQYTPKGDLELSADLADLGGGSAYQLLYTNSAGVVSQLPHGTSTHVLTSNGPSADPSWQAPSGGGASQLSDLSDVNTSTPTNRNVLVADGVDWESRALVEADISDLGTYLTDVVSDTTPQLGGSLDVNGQSIVSVSNGNITIAPNGTGNVLLGNFTLDADQTVGVGQDNYVLTYDNATGLISLEAAGGGGSSLTYTQDGASGAEFLYGANVTGGTGAQGLVAYDPATGNPGFRMYDDNSTLTLLGQMLLFSNDLYFDNRIVAGDYIFRASSSTASDTTWLKYDTGLGSFHLSHSGSEVLQSKSNGIRVKGATFPQVELTNTAGTTTYGFFFQDTTNNRLTIRAQQNGHPLEFQVKSGTSDHTAARFTPAAGADVYYNNTVHFSTISSGINTPFFLNFDRSTLTISGGVVTASRTHHRIDTQGGAGTDDLDTINGGVTGHILILYPASGARTVVMKDGTGNLALAGDFSMDNAQDTIMLIYNGTNWLELSRSDNGA